MDGLGHATLGLGGEAPSPDGLNGPNSSMLRGRLVLDAELESELESVPQVSEFNAGMKCHQNP